MTIIDTDHCKLCDLKIIDFNIGTLCSLTNEKPQFDIRCPKIVLEDVFEKQITDINIEYDSVIKSKTNQIGLVIYNLILSLLILILGVIITNYIFKKGYFSTISLAILVIAFIPFTIGIGTLNTYLTDLKIAKKKKERLDSTIAIYGFDYKIDIEHIKDSLGNIEHIVELKTFKVPTKS